MKVGVIVILYNPKPDDLAHVLQLSAVCDGVVVDNSAAPSFGEGKVGRLGYVCNGANLGIAEAQNIGLRYLEHEGGYTHVVFLDQDSRTPHTYPQDIAREFDTVRGECPRLAMLGPTVVNKASGEEYRSVVHTYQTQASGFSVRQDIISSGSCASMDALKDIGYMDGGLFIDYVDFEWCWRAASKGYVCGMTQNVRISHMVGHAQLSFGRYKVILSAPVRYYYQYRNYLWLVRRSYVSASWKRNMGVKLFARLFYFPFVVKGWREIEKNMWKGIRDGLFRKYI